MWCARSKTSPMWPEPMRTASDDFEFLSKKKFFFSPRQNTLHIFSFSFVLSPLSTMGLVFELLLVASPHEKLSFSLCEVSNLINFQVSKILQLDQFCQGFTSSLTHSACVYFFNYLPFPPFYFLSERIECVWWDQRNTLSRSWHHTYSSSIERFCEVENLSQSERAREMSMMIEKLWISLVLARAREIEKIGLNLAHILYTHFPSTSSSSSRRRREKQKLHKQKAHTRCCSFSLLRRVGFIRRERRIAKEEEEEEDHSR